MISYDDILADSGTEARAREAGLLGRSADLMRRADRKGATSGERVEASRFAERLWTHLLDDLGHPSNALEPALRADLISIGIFVMRASAEAARGERSFAACADITEQLRAGLAAPVHAGALS